MKRIIIFPLLIFIVLALVACGGDDAETETTTEPAFTPVEFDNEDLGVRVSHPEDWVIQDSMGGVTLASSQAVVDSNSLADIEDGGFVVIIPGEIAVFNFQTNQDLTADEPLRGLEVYKLLLEKNGQVFTEIESAEVLDVDGQNIAVMTVSSEEAGEEMVTVLGVVMSGDYMAMISAGSLASATDDLRPTFDQIIETIEVYPPTLISE